MGRWDQGVYRDQNFANIRGEVEALIVLAAAGTWVITLAVIGLAASTETMNVLQEIS